MQILLNLQVLIYANKISTNINNLGNIKIHRNSDMNFLINYFNYPYPGKIHSSRIGINAERKIQN